MIWRHNKSGDLYFVLKDDLKMKHPTSGEWVYAVLYRRVLPDGEVFVREFNDFVKKFTLGEEKP